MQFDPRSISELLDIINTPAGQQLISMLRQKGGTDLTTAVEKAEKGEYQDAQKVISSLLQDPETKKLLQQLGR